MDVVQEDWWRGPTAVMQTIFPSVIIQQQVNSLSTRQIIPQRSGRVRFRVDPFRLCRRCAREMTERRLKQANLFRAGRIVSLDDGEVIEYCQQATSAYPDGECVVALGGNDSGAASPHMVTETLIRGACTATTARRWRGEQHHFA